MPFKLTWKPMGRGHTFFSIISCREAQLNDWTQTSLPIGQSNLSTRTVLTHEATLLL